MAYQLLIKSPDIQDILSDWGPEWNGLKKSFLGWNYSI